MTKIDYKRNIFSSKNQIISINYFNQPIQTQQYQQQKNYMNENTSQNDILPKSNTNEKPKPNRHVSVLYGMQYLTRVPVVKRCRKTEYQCFANINKKEIFTLLHCFVGKLLNSEEFLDKTFEETKFDENQLESTIVHTPQVQNKTPLLQEKLSQNSLNGISFDKIEDNFTLNKKSLNPKTKQQKSCKKISIMMDGCFSDFQDQDFGSALFSDQSLSGISSVDISHQQFTLSMVQSIYEQPQPFLINLSVCLMLKFLFCSNTKLTTRNVCWILSIGTIVAYKIYYDEPVEGLVDSFAYILKIKREDIVTLERHFLSEINYEAVISNEQYHSTLFQIIKEGHNQK